MLLIWFTTAAILLIYVTGECLPPGDPRCPTVAEGRWTGLTIVLSGVIASIGASWMEVRMARRKHS